MPISIENNSWDYVQGLIEKEINSAFKLRVEHSISHQNTNELKEVTPSRESKIMPLYDFKCDKCENIVEEFFKLDDEKKIECCGTQMEQVILKAPGGIKPGEQIVQTKGGVYMKDTKSGSLRKVGAPKTRDR